MKISSSDQSKRKPSQILLDLSHQCQEGDLSFRQLIERLGVRSHSLIVLLFSLPFLTPIPLPGLSLVFGSVIMASGLAVFLQGPIWLPGLLAAKKTHNQTLAIALRAAAKILQKFEWILRPRFTGLTTNPLFRSLVGLLILASGFLLALPLPPGTNFPPALTCSLLALGLLEEDGLLLCMGIGVFFAQIFVLGLFANYFANLMA